jgi:DNA-binding MarR family transcriptional regulator/N-acetylglutamate synthase-like GNAT family acetyltransferase
MARAVARSQVNAVRRFNRFYTGQIGLLQEHLLASSFTLTQARVLFELGTQESLTAKEIGESLGLDRGYLSRMLEQFATDGLIRRRKSSDDGRKMQLSLTAKGKQAFASLDHASQDATSESLVELSSYQRRRLLEAMGRVQRLLTGPVNIGNVKIRTHEIGDIGWAIEQHARLYAEEYGWDQGFEALVATLFADFASKHDPATEHCWIAEVDNERAGCVFVVRNAEDSTTAQLRCLLVDPVYRGMGIGTRLVDECLKFAKKAGYQKMILWTNDVLTSARKIYEQAGFQLIDENRHESFGKGLVGQTWMRAI